MIYLICKRVIERGNYVRADMLLKLDVYLLFDRLTQAQYAELLSLMGDANVEA